MLSASTQGSWEQLVSTQVQEPLTWNFWYRAEFQCYDRNALNFRISGVSAITRPALSSLVIEMSQESGALTETWRPTVKTLRGFRITSPSQPQLSSEESFIFAIFGDLFMEIIVTFYGPLKCYADDSQCTNAYSVSARALVEGSLLDLLTGAFLCLNPGQWAFMLTFRIEKHDFDESKQEKNKKMREEV
ncbi:hypothetical protein ARMSODRAFT_982098 [Armillaria solidipes]|uniref:Uncharacterized protein n=1 Tax=Armillaria solidipes TaxID=1076256 RepID=A0A2H3APH8_9AGAR|nr:hypothetical protein ARMSODRAFT_982098 [Armillaria solidipes]